jgi:hypothetical protein
MKTTRICVLGCLVAGVLGAAAVGAEIKLKPVRATGSYSIVGNTIIVNSTPQWVFLEVTISGWDPDLNGTPLLRTWQAEINSAGYSSGLAGTLTPASTACAVDGDCRTPFGGVCSIFGNTCVVTTDCTYYPYGEVCGGAPCDYPTGVGGYCSPGFQFSGRTDGVLLKQLPAVDVATLDYRYGATTSPSGPPMADPGTPGYGGTLVLNVPVGARGTFTVGFTDSGSFLRDPDNALIEPLTLTPALIAVRCYTGADCDDADPCTNNVCTGGLCSNPYNTAPCNDGNPCNIGEACLNGVCTGGGPVNCSGAGNDCNTASCNPLGPEGNCNILTPKPNGTPCNDGLFCTDNEFCTNGVCGSGSAHDCSYLSDQCNNGVCNETLNQCVKSPTNQGLPCNDNLFCTDNDKCANGVCTGPAHYCGYLTDQCNLGVCNETLDDCVAQPRNEGLACNDGQACNVGEKCQSGVCTGGGPPNCSGAGDDCNTASCDPQGAQGNCDILTPANEGLPCDDGEYCTVDEFCTGGNCGGGTSRDCDDAVSCTDDSCDEVGNRCDHDPNDTLCPDDGLWCNGNEYCHVTLDCGHTGSPCSGPCDEVDDKCLCDAPIVEGAGGRYLRIAPQPVESGPQAILITPNCPAGDPKYVGEPTALSAGRGGASAESYARLVDDPDDAAWLTPPEWGNLGEVYVYGLDIVPNTPYFVQGDCGAPGSPGLSDQSVVTTRKWGDTALPYNTVNFVDIAALVDAFKGVPGHPIYRVDLVGPNGSECIPGQQVDFLDIGSAVDGFRGKSYQQTWPTCPVPCP